MRSRKIHFPLRNAVAAACAGLIGLAFAPASRGGSVVRDGTVGPRGAIPKLNNSFNVPASSGKQVGGNLFHSFSDFNLDPGEAATFSGPASVHNVLTRVTGGSASSINGTIRCTIPDANFYLVNPAGVVFGPNAKLDVQGSFAVTTADVVKLADGGTFHASNPAASVLTTAAPAAFGFLAAKPASIQLTGAASTTGGPPTLSTLEVPPGKVLSVVGGPVQMLGAVINAPGGRVNVVSVGSPGDVAFDPASTTATLDTSTVGTMGNVSLLVSRIVTDADASGSIFVRAADLSLSFSSTIASGNVAGPGGAIDLRLTGAATLASGSSIQSSTDGPADAGPVTLKAASLTMDDPDGSSILSSAVFEHGTGTAGTVHVEAPTVHVSGTAQIDSFAFGAGNVGRIEIVADDLSLSGALRQDRRPRSRRRQRRRRLDPVQEPDGQRRGEFFPAQDAPVGGVTDIRADSLLLTGSGSAIFGDNAGLTGAGGGIRIKGGSVLVSDGASLNDEALTGPANGGPISIDADSVHVVGGANVKTSTVTAGRAGDITITTTGAVVVSGTESNISAAATNIDGIPTPTSTPTGNGGNVSIKAGSVAVLDGGTIDSNNAGGQGARGGTIQIQTHDLLVRGVTTQIVTATLNSGDAGAIQVQADRVLLSGLKAGIRAPTGVVGEGGVSGKGGDVTIRAGELVLEKGANILTSSRATDMQGNVEPVANTTGRTGAAGNITLAADRLVLRTGTQGDPTKITSEAGIVTQGTGSAGDIRVTTRMLEAGPMTRISVETQGSGAGGDIRIDGGRRARRGGRGRRLQHRHGRRRQHQLDGPRSPAGRRRRAGDRVGAAIHGRQPHAHRRRPADPPPRHRDGRLRRHRRERGTALRRHDLRPEQHRHRQGGRRRRADRHRPAHRHPPRLHHRRPLRGPAGRREDRLRRVLQQRQPDPRQPHDRPARDRHLRLPARPPRRPRPPGATLAPVCGVRTGEDFSSFITTGRGGAPPEPGGWSPDWIFQTPKPGP